LSVSIADFWRLLSDSRLLKQGQVEQLAGDFGQSRNASGEADAKTLSKWLIGRNVISAYQARILLAGRAGPFHYGEYVLYDRVEGGRFGGHFRAVHAPSRHPVLLQFLTGPVISEPSLWAAAVGNVLAACRIVSPHVQRFFELVDLQAFKFLVCEDLRGSTLEERLAAGRIPPAEACRIARLAALGLAHMHQLGRVHGDVRLPNVLIEASSHTPANVKMLFAGHESPEPFDLAQQQQQPGARLAEAADYLAPELLHPGRPPDPLCDIYALGCALYAALAGGLPFAGGSVQDKLRRHASEPIRPLETLGVPPPLAQIVAYMMAKNPAVRFQSAVQVAEQLAHFVEPAALHAQPPAAPATLARYEQHVRTKQPLPAATLAAGHAHGTTTAADPAPFTLQSEGQRLAAAIGDTGGNSDAGSAAAAIQLNVPSKKRSNLTAEEVLRRRKQMQRRNLLLGLASAVVLAIGAGVAVNILGRTGGLIVEGSPSREESRTPQPSEEEVTNSDPLRPAGTDAGKPAGKQGAVSATGLEVIHDDGQTLWAAPTTGPPVEMRCVPPEGQAFMMVRPADILASSEGAKVLQALGPEFDRQRQAWESASGFGLADIEQLIVTLHSNDARFPRSSFVVTTAEPFKKEDLLSRWGNPAPVEADSGTFYSGPTWAYYLPPDDDGRTFAMGEPRDMQEVAAEAGAAARMFPGIERLRRATDSHRHFTVLLFPQFLFNDDGEPLFSGPRAKLREPLSWLLGDHLQAASASAHFGETFYFEVRMLGTLDNDPHKLASALRDRLNELPRSLEDHFVTLTPPPYWRKLAFRYPGMVSELHRQTRVGVEDAQAVVNTVLPEAAAHNLVLGGELLVSSAPGQATTVATAPPPAGPQTIEEALQLKTSYSFDSQSLEFAMRDLAADVKDMTKGAPFDFQIKIIGSDLEKDGITRNQSISNFKQDNQPVADILTALVMKANPITTVREPSEADQKLLWTVAADPDNASQQVVLITTRAAAAAKGYELPPQFNK
jgi:eukaryotic-like serine/threonine-protein kinase